MPEYLPFVWYHKRLGIPGLFGPFVRPLENQAPGVSLPDYGAHHPGNHFPLLYLTYTAVVKPLGLQVGGAEGGGYAKLRYQRRIRRVYRHELAEVSAVPQYTLSVYCAYCGSR